MMTRRLDVLLARRERIHSAFEEGTYDSKTMQRRLAVVQEEERKLIEDIEATKAEYEKHSSERITREEVARVIHQVAKNYSKVAREDKAELNRALFAVIGTPTIRDDYKMLLPGGPGFGMYERLLLKPIKD